MLMSGVCAGRSLPSAKLGGAEGVSANGSSPAPGGESPWPSSMCTNARAFVPSLGV